jgi:peroxiredoxin
MSSTSSLLAPALLLAFIGCSTATTSAPVKPAPAKIQAQEPANTPKTDALDAAFTAPDGNTVHLSDFRGKRSVVLLFQRGYDDGSACFYCAKQTNAYKAAYADLQSAGAEVVMILPGTLDTAGYLGAIGQMDDEHPDPAFSVPFPVLGDPDFSACRTFDVPHVDAGHGFPVSQPATFVISKDGTELLAYHGKQPGDRPTVETVLAVLRTGKKAEDPSVAAPTPAAPSVSRPTLAWVSYDEGIKAAREQKRPVLLEFYADW